MVLSITRHGLRLTKVLCFDSIDNISLNDKSPDKLLKIFCNKIIFPVCEKRTST